MKTVRTTQNLLDVPGLACNTCPHQGLCANRPGIGNQYRRGNALGAGLLCLLEEVDLLTYTTVKQADALDLKDLNARRMHLRKLFLPALNGRFKAWQKYERRHTMRSDQLKLIITLIATLDRWSLLSYFDTIYNHDLEALRKEILTAPENATPQNPCRPGAEEPQNQTQGGAA